MTGSLAERPRPGLALAVLVLALALAGPARAQTTGGGAGVTAPEPLSEPQAEPGATGAPTALDQPLELAPPGGLTGDGAQPSATGAKPLAPPAGAKPAFGGNGSENGAVQVQTLRAIGADSTGTLTETQGGFGDAMWRGSNRQVIETLIGRIGAPDGLGAADLTRRLLLSSASVPAGDGKAGDFLEIRVRALARAGRMADIDALVGGVAPGLKTQGTKRVETDALLLAGDDARACAVAAAEQSTDPAPFWTLVLAYCQVLGGQAAEAELAVSLLRETGEVPARFETVFQALQAGQPAVLDGLDDLSALTIAMMRTSGATAGPDAALPPVPAFWPALAGLESLPDGLRAEAAEAALALDLIDRATAKAVVDSFTFEPDAVAGALTGAELTGGALGRALLLRAAEGQTVATARAELAAKAMQLADTVHARAATAKQFLPIIQRLPGSSELVWFAEYGLGAGILAREPQGAARWLQMLSAGAVFRPDMKTALDRLLPIARIARVPGADRWSAESFAAWRSAAQGAGVPPAGQVWLLGALSALGERLAPTDWMIAVDAAAAADVGGTVGAAPGPGIQAAVMAAGAAQRVGETVATALAAMSETRSRPSAGAAFAVAQALSQCGLDAEARALLLDAALGFGL